jgi:steroid 5-alpha reductase family enzyme
MMELILAVLLGLVLAMSAAWLVQRLTGNCSWVDVVWSFATGAAGVFFALAPATGAPPGIRQIAVAVLVAAWSIRLGGHIALRASAGQDDPRYADLRREWGPRFQVRLFLFLMVQALVAWGLALSMLLAARNPAPGFRALDLLGVAILATAVAGEAIADHQLRKFKLDPANRGKVCDAGLWSWSRHPNYFFEWLGWVAYPLFAIGFQWWWGWLALSGPAVMFWTLRYASGVPPLEAHMLRRYGDAFRSYQARVNIFFPGPPKILPAARTKPGAAA